MKSLPFLTATIHGCRGPLERVVAVFSRNPNVGVVSGSIEGWEDSQNGAKVVLKSSLLHLHKGMTVQYPATFVRRSVYNCVGLFNTHYRIGADYDFVLRCLTVNITWVILEDVLTLMRAGGKGGSTFNFDDCTIRRSHKLSSVISETCIYANSFIRYLVRQSVHFENLRRESNINTEKLFVAKAGISIKKYLRENH